MAVPGCDGGKEDSSASDYCVSENSNAPPTPSPPTGPPPTSSNKRIRYRGNNGSPREVFPLGLCEGVIIVL